ncbi:Zn-dependent hydrolase [Candidatus Pacearchaeota archaeon]|jgi:L-ascorbate metabolism protein UlaG (beta-lactamase superfamily)|nr:Zn-dependent hydrolase [Candidatus Pacearchaeota archaeon]|tara:strand:+ start:1022 stop:1687 length:666 start_codon:yes stop_codon:yes gene_type:complete
MKIDDVEIKWLGHVGFLIKNSKVIYIDPYNLKGENEKADFILLTHSHYDHCSIVDIEKIIKDGTKIIATADCQSKITRFDVPIKIEIIEPGQELEFGNIKISTLPAYNINKHFHPKEEGWVGYLIKINNVLIYHAGDTDVISEMKNLTGYKHSDTKFIALLPVEGRLTMSAEEAYEAAKIIKPTLAIPMHWGSIVGTENDAKEFVELCKEGGINAEILDCE